MASGVVVGSAMHSRCIGRAGFEGSSDVNTFSMMSHRLARSAPRVLGALCAGVLLVPGLSHSAAAQGRLEARYEATLAGIPVGKGTWAIDIGEDQFSAAAAGGTA